MAEDRIGGVSVDIGADLSGFDSALARVEEALKELSSRATVAKIDISEASVKRLERVAAAYERISRGRSSGGGGAASAAPEARVAARETGATQATNGTVKVEARAVASDVRAQVEAHLHDPFPIRLSIANIEELRHQLQGIGVQVLAQAGPASATHTAAPATAGGGLTARLAQTQAQATAAPVDDEHRWSPLFRQALNAGGVPKATTELFNALNDARESVGQVKLQGDKLSDQFHSIIQAYGKGAQTELKDIVELGGNATWKKPRPIIGGGIRELAQNDAMVRATARDFFNVAGAAIPAYRTSLQEKPSVEMENLRRTIADNTAAIKEGTQAASQAANTAVGEARGAAPGTGGAALPQRERTAAQAVIERLTRRDPGAQRPRSWEDVGIPGPGGKLQIIPGRHSEIMALRAPRAEPASTALTLPQEMITGGAPPRIGALATSGIDLMPFMEAAKRGYYNRIAEELEKNQGTGRFIDMPVDDAGKPTLKGGSRGLVPGYGGQFRALRPSQALERDLLAAGVPEEAVAQLIGPGGAAGPFLAAGRNLRLPRRPEQGSGGLFAPGSAESLGGTRQEHPDRPGERSWAQEMNRIRAYINEATEPELRQSLWGAVNDELEAHFQANRQGTSVAPSVGLPGGAPANRKRIELGSGVILPGGTQRLSSESAQKVLLERKRMEQFPQLDEHLTALMASWDRIISGKFGAGTGTARQQIREAISPMTEDVYDMLGLTGRTRSLKRLEHIGMTQFPAGVRAIFGNQRNLAQFAEQDANRLRPDARSTGLTEREINRAPVTTLQREQERVQAVLDEWEKRRTIGIAEQRGAITGTYTLTDQPTYTRTRRADLQRQYQREIEKARGVQVQSGWAGGVTGNEELNPLGTTGMAPADAGGHRNDPRGRTRIYYPESDPRTIAKRAAAERAVNRKYKDLLEQAGPEVGPLRDEEGLFRKVEGEGPTYQTGAALAAGGADIAAAREERRRIERTRRLASRFGNLGRFQGGDAGTVLGAMPGYLRNIPGFERELQEQLQFRMPGSLGKNLIRGARSTIDLEGGATMQGIPGRDLATGDQIRQAYAKSGLTPPGMAVTPEQLIANPSLRADANEIRSSVLGNMGMAGGGGTGGGGANPNGLMRSGVVDVRIVAPLPLSVTLSGPGSGATPKESVLYNRALSRANAGATLSSIGPNGAVTGLVRRLREQNPGLEDSDIRTVLEGWGYRSEAAAMFPRGKRGVGAPKAAPKAAKAPGQAAQLAAAKAHLKRIQDATVIGTPPQEHVPETPEQAAMRELFNEPPPVGPRMKIDRSKLRYSQEDEDQAALPPGMRKKFPSTSIIAHHGDEEIGRLQMHREQEKGGINEIFPFVKAEARGQGVGTALYGEATKRGFPVEEISAAHAAAGQQTDLGSGLFHARQRASGTGPLTYFNPETQAADLKAAEERVAALGGGGGGGGGGIPTGLGGFEDPHGKARKRILYAPNPQITRAPYFKVNPVEQSLFRQRQREEERVQREAVRATNDQARIARQQAGQAARGVRGPSPQELYRSLIGVPGVTSDMMAGLFVQPRRPDLTADAAQDPRVLAARQAARGAAARLPSRSLGTSAIQIAQRLFGGREEPEQRILELQRETGDLTRLGTRGQGIFAQRAASRLEAIRARGVARAIQVEGHAQGVVGPVPLPPTLLRQIKASEEAYAKHTDRQTKNTEAIARQADKVEKLGNAAVTTKNVLQNLAAGFVGGVGGSIVTLGVGAVVGKILMPALELLGAAIQPAVAELTGFNEVTNKVIGAASDQVRASHGLTRETIASMAAMSGLSAGTYKAIAPTLEQAANIEAGNKALGDQLDLIHAATNTSGRGTPRGLLTATGGFNFLGMDTPIGATPSTIERVTGGFTSPAEAAVGEGAAAGLNPLRAFDDVVGIFQGKLPASIQKVMDANTAWAKNLNEIIGRGKSGITVGTNATDEERQKTYAAALAVGIEERQAARLRDAGVAFRDKGGQVTPQSIQTGLAEIAANAFKPTLEAIMPQLERSAINMVQSTQRQTQLQLRGNAAGAALQGVTAPLQPFGTTIPGGPGGVPSAGYEQAAARLGQLQAGGRADLAQWVPPGLLNELGAVSSEISVLNRQANQIQLGQAMREFEHNTMLAKRQVADLRGLVGQAGGSEVGNLERANLLQGRHLQLLQFEQAQRQLNYRVALAGFTAEGATGEERAARIRVAQKQGAFEQTQLTGQRQMFARGNTIVDIQNVRALSDAVFHMDDVTKRWEEGRQLAGITATVEVMSRVQATLEANVASYMNQAMTIEQGYLSLAQTAAEATGKYLNEVYTQVTTTLRQAVNDLATMMPGGIPGGKKNEAGNKGIGATPTGEGILPIPGTPGANPGGKTEVGRQGIGVTPLTGGVSNSVTINNPSVRNDGDISKIAQQVEEALNRKSALFGAPRPI